MSVPETNVPNWKPLARRRELWRGIEIRPAHRSYELLKGSYVQTSSGISVSGRVGGCSNQDRSACEARSACEDRCKGGGGRIFSRHWREWRAVRGDDQYLHATDGRL